MYQLIMKSLDQIRINLFFFLINIDIFIFTLMNPSCLVCDSPATRVCLHKECTLSPFLCSGPCAKNASSIMHTHNSQQNFISYKEFEKRVERTKRLLNPQDLHNEYLEEMRKKVDVIKEYLKNKIDECLERFYQHIKNEICVEIQLQLTEEEEEMVDKIQGNFNNILLTGKDLNELWRNQCIFQWQRAFEAQVDFMKKAFDKQLKQIQGLSIKQEDEFPSYNKIVRKSEKLFTQGRQLFKDKQYKQALFKFIQSRQINNFDYDTHFCIGECLFELDQLDEAENSCKIALSLYPRFSFVYQKIGQIYQRRKNFEEAISQYSKAIQINRRWSHFFSKRGSCFIKLKRFEQAIADYFTASKLQPSYKQYKFRIEYIGKLMNKNQ